MATINLLNNLPVKDLTPDNDYLGIIDKGNLIANFLKANKEQFADIKMFTLYGEWGSGKSTLMKYIQKEVQGDFNTYFFEAWEYEKDENLAMSLLEYIDTKRADSGEMFCDKVLDYGKRIFKGFGKSVKLNFFGTEFDTKSFIEEIEKEPASTFLQILEKFKEEFRAMEDEIVAKSGELGESKDWNLVFIDDLDRCEPEQVLNLLSAIKLFFTYGQRTIFFCGIDKKAVEEAVKTKYGEIVKANEYLEKIFDISFTMNKHVEIDKLINIYFDDRVFKFDNAEVQLNKEIVEFFRALQFTNPRRIKKVLNKYSLLLSVIELQNEKTIAPNLYNIRTREGSLFETLLVLYLVILFEFYPDIFEDYGDMNKVLTKFKTLHENKKRSLNVKAGNGLKVVESYELKYDVTMCELNSFIYKKMESVYDGGYNDTIQENIFKRDSLPLFFSPVNSCIDLLYHSIDLKDCIFVQSETTIDKLFYDYIITRLDYLLCASNHSKNTLVTIKDFVALSL